MIKKLFLITFILFIVSVNNAFGHTGLESSSPQDGEVITAGPNDIKMTFETKVEQGSTFEVTNANGEPISIENITLSNNQLTGRLLNELANGAYKVNWKIIGADGHPIEGEFSFSVNTPTTTDPTEENEDSGQKNTEKIKMTQIHLMKKFKQNKSRQNQKQIGFLP